MAAGGGRSETRLQFFKVLMPGFSERMLIPREFTKFIPHEKRMTITILSPLGRFWHVKLNTCGSDLFLGSGWKEFAQAHGLAIGMSLVFRYEGNRVFTIKVYDSSGCLKNYDDGFRYSTKLEEENLKKDEMNAKRPKCKEDYIECSDVVDIEEVEDDSEEEEEDEVEDDHEEEEEDVKEIKPKCRGQEDVKEIKPIYPGQKSSPTKAKEIERIIRPYNLRYNVIRVPKDFCSVHRPDSRRNIVLKDMNDRSWPALFSITRSEGNFLRKGWDGFCKVNDVEPGDRCIFRLGSKGVIRVHVVKD